jgi:hypothetical protein
MAEAAAQFHKGLEQLSMLPDDPERQRKELQFWSALSEKAQHGGEWFRPFRLKRVVDIVGEQSRALRVRSFINYLQSHPAGGAYLQIGAQAQDKLRLYGRQDPALAEKLLRQAWATPNGRRPRRHVPHHSAPDDWRGF